jgi:hypothetical protein
VQSNEVAPSGSAPPFIPNEAYQKTPEEELKEHPKGCGCDASGMNAARMGLWMIAPALVLFGLLRRKKR